MRPRVLLFLVLGAGVVAACSSGGTHAPAVAGFSPGDAQRTIDSDLPRTVDCGGNTFQPEQDS